MSYRLGVDIGTTFTAAAVANGSAPTMVGLGNRALQIPSVLFLQPDGNFLVGEAAERRGLTEPSRLVREFKRRIGDPVPILIAGSPYSPQSLAATVLRWVLNTTTERMGEPPDEVILTHPANWGAYKLELLDQIATLADLRGARRMPEPVAAAAQYAASTRVAVGDRLAVYDLGGGTFDVCVLEKTADGFAPLGTPEGIEHLGGVDFDEVLFQMVIDVLSGDLQRLDPADPGVIAGLARLRRDCVDAKEALSSDTDVVLAVALPGLSTSVRLNRAEFEALIRPALMESVAAMSRALKSAEVDPKDLTAIVLIGGSSRIPLVGELLSRAFGVRTALDSHPKHDVALGAVQASRDASSTLRPTRAESTIPQAGRPGSAAAATPPDAAPAAGPANDPAAAPDGASTLRSQRRDPGDTAMGAGDLATGTPTATPAAAGPAASTGTAGSVGTPPGAGPAPAAAAGTLVGRRKLRREQAKPPGSGDGSGTASGLGRPKLRRLLIIAGAVAICLGVVTGIVVVQLRGADTASSTGPATAGPLTAPANSTGSASPASPPAVPRSKPLTDTELIVPMQVGGNWQLYLGDLESPAPVRVLTSEAGDAYTPALSPDFATMIYLLDRDGSGTRRVLRLAGVDGSDPRDLFATVPDVCAGNMFRPAWRPDDPSVLAVPCQDAGGRYGLYLVRTDGTLIRQVRVDQQRVDDPTFSPSGRQLAFWAGPLSGFDGGELYVTDADGRGEPDAITTAEIAGQDTDPAWSPVGDQIAFRRRVADQTTGGNADVFRVRPDGSGLKRLTDNAADEQDPSWSRFGNRIVYKSAEPTKAWPGTPVARVWVMNADGTGQRVLWTEGEASGTQGAPIWSRR